MAYVFSMGLRYTCFRAWYELKRRSGLLRRQFPTHPKFTTWITLDSWRTNAPPFFFHARDQLDQSSGCSEQLREAALRIMGGELQFFFGEWKPIALADWTTNLVTGYRYPTDKHWTDIPDFHPQYGDIKYVWERSRFGFLQTILRYDALERCDSSEWVFTQIESWIDSNPINQGPNYRCSQEISLRTMNWLFALYFYRDAPALTEKRFEKILFSLYWQLKHVRANINFSRIAVRNNHALTEALMLYSAGLLLPFFPEAREWERSGKQWFEQEVIFQLFPDGGYVQFSHNYHRVAVQLLTWAIALAKLHKQRFKKIVYDRAYAALNFLLHVQDPVSGHLPNYGANDGSLFFQWSDASFRDFRPQLGTLHYLLTGQNLNGAIFADYQWFGCREGLRMFPPPAIPVGPFAFPRAGMYGFRSEHSLLCINAVNFKTRPSQADGLHLDWWHHGSNLLQDAGSYRYNAPPELIRYFAGTESHNTVMIDDMDQMQKGPRFIWLHWTTALEATWRQEGKVWIFAARLGAFRHRGRGVFTRTVRIDEDLSRMVVNDTVTGVRFSVIRQLWHLPVERKAGVVFSSSGRKIEQQKFYSPTYGMLQNALQVGFVSAENVIETHITRA